MNEILDLYQPITLDEMSGIRLMNRTDTKFVTTKEKLRLLLSLAKDDYRVQDINGERISPYYTVYFDTSDMQMYRRHLTGRAFRQKLRIRSYVHSNLNFLEVKTKNNHGRTKKDRVKLADFDPVMPEHDIRFGATDQPWAAYDGFLHDHLDYNPQVLSEQLENHFNRITLVNKSKTERLTIDFDLSFDNLTTGSHLQLGNVVIIEIKRDGLQPSPILRYLQQLRIKPMGFSKYIIGSILTNRQLPHNRLKPRIKQIEKLCH
jgi:hypothetical protein